jgi:hypothetical protein
MVLVTGLRPLLFHRISCRQPAFSRVIETGTL